MTNQDLDQKSEIKAAKGNDSAENEKSKSDPNYGYSIIILGFASTILTMPLFMLLYKYFPAMEISFGDTEIRLDHILLFLVIFFATYYLLRKFRTIVFFILISGLVVLTITNFSGIYTMENLYHDYAEFLYDLSENSLRQKFMNQDGKFKREKELREAIDYKDYEVRNYAASIAVKHFDEQAYLSKNKKWVQFFSVFKEIYGH